VSLAQEWVWKLQQALSCQAQPGLLRALLKLQLAAQNLAGYRGEYKNRDIFEFDMGKGPCDEYERDGNMDIEKPAQGVSLCFCPQMAEGKVHEQGKRA